MSAGRTGKMPISGVAGGEGGKKVRCRTGIISQEPEYLSGPPHSVAVALCATPARLTKTRLQQKLLRKKKNESWTMRRFENIRRLTSPTLGVGGNLLCKIVQFVFFGSRYSSSRLYSVSRRRLRRPLRRVTQRQSQWLCQQRVSIFRSINRQQRSQSFHRKTSSRSKFNA